MLRFAALAALTFALAFPVDAQHERLRPLQVGNEWVYASRTYTFYTSGNPAEQLSIRAFRVVRDTTLDGNESRIVTCREFEMDGETLIRESELNVPIVPVAAGYGLSGFGITLGCGTFFAWVHEDSFAALPRQVEAPAAVGIGESTYPVDTLVTMRFAYDSNRTQGNVVYGSDIGMTFYDYSEFRNTGIREARLTLVYARVGGRVFGASPVPVSALPSAPGPRVHLKAYPSPASRSLTVESPRGHVLIYDLLGRRVAQIEVTGTQPTRLDVSAWPVGLYIARTVTPEGPQTARFVVAR